MRLAFFIICAVFCWTSVFANAEDEFIMACRQFSGLAPDGTNLNGATVYQRPTDLSFYLLSTSEVPLTFVSETSAGANKTEVYSAHGCKFTFYLPIQQPGEGFVECDNGVFGGCINSVE